MRAVVTGMIATYPVGGVGWDYGQYALGLEKLGWDVIYLEDTGWQTYDPVRGEYGEDCTYGVRFLQESLRQLSPALAGNWHFRAMDGRCYGMDRRRLESVVAGADLFLNVSGGTLLRDEYMPCSRKALIDSDPGWNHFVNFPKWDASPGWQGAHGYRAHDFFFTYAERMGRPDCVLPDMGIHWHPTRPLVVMDCWRPIPPAEKWTTVMTWNNFRRPVEYGGRTYGTKELEFPKVEGLPARLGQVQLELATGGSGAPVQQWQRLGWQVVDSHSVSGTVNAYRDYIQQSRGEFSVAKNLYTATRSGWFSCRSVCYLAAGRPCVVQDTGFSEIIPTGCGLMAFSDLDSAVDAVARVEADYPTHQRAAIDVARSYFDSRVVLGDMLAAMGLT